MKNALHISTLCLVATALCVLIALTGCNQNSTELPDTKNSVARSHAKLDEIELSFDATPGKLRLSDELQLRLTIRKRSDVRADFPGMEDSLTEFTIRDVQTPLPKLDGQFETIQQVYRLEPKSIGKHTITPPAVTYSLAGSGSGDQVSAPQQIIEADPFDIEVTSELGGQTAKLDQLRPENQPLDLPPDRKSTAIWISLLAVAIALMSILAVRLARRQTKPPTPLTPRERARSELKSLIQANWAKLDPKRYFVELTGIVRRFIEGTTGVHAPEQTTEEFLRAITNDRTFADDVQARLRNFLESADLVKFAGLKPSDEEISESLDRASRFIEGEIESIDTQPQEQNSK
jgi:hypothetical protein